MDTENYLRLPKKFVRTFRSNNSAKIDVVIVFANISKFTLFFFVDSLLRMINSNFDRSLKFEVCQFKEKH